MSHKKVIEPAAIRDSMYLGEQFKTFNPVWEQWYNSVSEYSVGIESYEETFTPSSVSANTTSEQTFTVTGIGANDRILSVTKPTHQAGLGIVNTRVSAANQIAITYMNTTAGGITPISEEYIITVLRG